MKKDLQHYAITFNSPFSQTKAFFRGRPHSLDVIQKVYLLASVPNIVKTPEAHIYDAQNLIFHFETFKKYIYRSINILLLILFCLNYVFEIICSILLFLE